MITICVFWIYVNKLLSFCVVLCCMLFESGLRHFQEGKKRGEKNKEELQNGTPHLVLSKPAICKIIHQTTSWLWGYYWLLLPAQVFPFFFFFFPLLETIMARWNQHVAWLLFPLLLPTLPPFPPSGGYPTVGVCKHMENDTQEAKVRHLPHL